VNASIKRPLAEKEQAWETRVARKTRKKQATAADETETRGAKEARQGPAKDSVAGSAQGDRGRGERPVCQPIARQGKS
jgi:hypothetical protein